MPDGARPLGLLASVGVEPQTRLRRGFWRAARSVAPSRIGRRNFDRGS